MIDSVALMLIACLATHKIGKSMRGCSFLPHRYPEFRDNSIIRLPVWLHVFTWWHTGASLPARLMSVSDVRRYCRCACSLSLFTLILCTTQGDSMVQAKKVALLCLHHLPDKWSFNVIRFGSGEKFVYGVASSWIG